MKEATSNLVFSKILTTTDFHNVLIFTTDKFLNYLKSSSNNNVVVDPRKLHIEVVDEKETWQLGSGWSRFAYENKLKVGDLIELYSIDQAHGGEGGERERRFKIMATKPIINTSLFGETIDYYTIQ
ncbi:hypothetical protein ACFE04_002526 [Oxalis oulophora]